MPLVLVHNDVVANPDHAWDDVEGVRYHYPAKYQRKIITGEPFVYYRGVHRVGGRRGQSEYVGAGRIGAIWPDPSRPQGKNKAWYCAIEDFRRFGSPVAAKVDGVPLEDIPANEWRDSVRLLPDAVYHRIILAADGQPVRVLEPTGSALTIKASDNLIMPPAPVGRATSKSGFRKSKQAKMVGDWAEVIALRYIIEQLPGATACTHRAALGETPGWDIDYLDPAGALQRVEVKGTISGAFTGVEITAGEMRAAKAHGDSYWLYLVAGCLTDTPKVQAIQNPGARLELGQWTASPSVYSVKF